VERDELARRGGSGRGIAAGRGAKRRSETTGGLRQARKAAGLGAAVPGRDGALVLGS
jgi:hypothetical protein